MPLADANLARQRSHTRRRGRAQGVWTARRTRASAALGRAASNAWSRHRTRAVVSLTAATRSARLPARRPQICVRGTATSSTSRAGASMNAKASPGKKRTPKSATRVAAGVTIAVVMAPTSDAPPRPDTSKSRSMQPSGKTRCPDDSAASRLQ